MERTVKNINPNDIVPQEDYKTIELGARVNILRGALQMMIEDPEMPDRGKEAASTILMMDDVAEMPRNSVGEMKAIIYTLVEGINDLGGEVEMKLSSLQTDEAKELAKKVVERCEAILSEAIGEIEYED